ncbi:hypothetical protein D9M72_298710 [compost metagenome]
MSGVGVAVHERAGEVAVVGEGLLDAFVDHGGAKGDVTGGDALGQAHDVGLHAPQAAAEHLACAAEAGDDFIGDQQHAVLVADLADQRPVVLRRHDHATGALDRLGDEGGHGVRALELDFPLQQVGADLPEFFRVLAVRVAVEPGRVDVETARQQRLVVAAEDGIAVHRGAAEVGAVVALAQGNELGAVGLALQLPVLAGQLECGFHRVRTAGAEGHATHAFRFQHADHPGGQFFGAGMADAVEQLEILQFVQLCRDGCLDLRAAVADVDVPQPRHAIHQAVALVIEDEAALATEDADGFALFHFVGVQHGVPEGGVSGSHVNSPVVQRCGCVGHLCRNRPGTSCLSLPGRLPDPA